MLHLLKWRGHDVNNVVSNAIVLRLDDPFVGKVSHKAVPKVIML